MPPKSVKNYNLEGFIIPEIVFNTRVRDRRLKGDNPFKWKNISFDHVTQNIST